MGRFRFFLKPFADDGAYQSDWIEITEDVDTQGLSTIKESLDNSEYDVGIFKNGGLSLTLSNVDGRYSDVGSPNTYFKFSRTNSQIRITWEIMDRDTKCGFVKCGEFKLSPAVDIFVGLLNDDALKQKAEEQNLSFKVLGREAIFSQVQVPYSSINNGDSFSDVIFKCLNQTRITQLLNVSALNIVCGNNVLIDDRTTLENKTVLEALNETLLPSNSVLFIKNGTVYVSSRAESASTKFTFYGQGSLAGFENIIDLTDFRNGLNRTFNFWTWEETNLSAVDFTSADRYGIKKREIGCDLVTQTAKRQSVLNNLRTEFGSPKRELSIRIHLDYETLDLGLLDKVAIDYPNVAITETGVVPLWDVAMWDVAQFPSEILPIEIDSQLRFKILSRSIDPANQELILDLREV